MRDRFTSVDLLERPRTSGKQTQSTDSRLQSAIVDSVVRRLSAFGPLNDIETADMWALSSTVERRPARSILMREGERITPPRFLVSGWAACVRHLADGRRQILRFLLPGDGIGLQGAYQGVAIEDVMALTQVQMVDASSLCDRWERGALSSGLAQALRGAMRADQVLTQNQVVRLGAMAATERVADLLLELHGRLSIVGLASSQRFPLPMTQDVLSATIGVSPVHMNRILQQLRRDGLIGLKGSTVTLLRPEALSNLAGSAPAKGDA